MGVDKFVLSVGDLKEHVENPFHWGPEDLVRGLMSDKGFDQSVFNQRIGKAEILRDLVCFGSKEVRSYSEHARSMPVHRL